MVVPGRVALDRMADNSARCVVWTWSVVCGGKARTQQPVALAGGILNLKLDLNLAIDKPCVPALTIGRHTRRLGAVRCLGAAQEERRSVKASACCCYGHWTGPYHILLQSCSLVAPRQTGKRQCETCRAMPAGNCILEHSSHHSHRHRAVFRILLFNRGRDRRPSASDFRLASGTASKFNMGT